MRSSRVFLLVFPDKKIFGFFEPPLGHLYRIEELVLIDLGTVSKESMAMTSFRILNDTAQDLVVVRIKPDCSCTTVGSVEPAFNAGTSLQMTVSLPASNFIGPSLTKIDIYVQKYDEPIRVVLKSTLSSDVSMSRSSLSFGGPNDSGDLEITAGLGVKIVDVLPAIGLVRFKQVEKTDRLWKLNSSPLLQGQFGSEIVRVHYSIGDREEVRELPLEVNDSSPFRFLPRQLLLDVTDNKFTGRVRVVASEVVSTTDDFQLQFAFGDAGGSIDLSEVISRRGRLMTLNFEGHFDDANPENLQLVLIREGVVLARCPVQIVSSSR